MDPIIGTPDPVGECYAEDLPDTSRPRFESVSSKVAGFWLRTRPTALGLTYMPDPADQQRWAQWSRWALPLARLSTFRDLDTKRELFMQIGQLREYDGDYSGAADAYDRLLEDPRLSHPNWNPSRSIWRAAISAAGRAGEAERTFAYADQTLERFPHRDDHFNFSVMAAHAGIVAGDLEGAGQWLERAQGFARWWHDFAEWEQARAEYFAARWRANGNGADLETALSAYGAEQEHLTFWRDDGPWYRSETIDRTALLSEAGRCEAAAQSFARVLEHLPRPEDLNEDAGSWGLYDTLWRQCHVRRLGNDPEADRWCDQAVAAYPEHIAINRWERYYVPLPPTDAQPLACFASGDDPDQGGSADQADRG
jgi:tetratricopeptide (TPR) repeat protein